MTIRILLADDHKIIRDGLRAILDKHPDLSVVAEAENGRKAVALARKHQPDVMIVDINMPDLNGMEATRQILDDQPEIRVIALSMLSDRRQVVGMLRAGASGYLLKDCASEELILAIQTVSRGQTYLSPLISGIVKECLLHQLEDDSPINLLTPREREILQLIAEGKSVKNIASHLNVSIKTVETHRQNIMKKLEIDNLAALIKLSIREGVISLDT